MSMHLLKTRMKRMSVVCWGVLVFCFLSGPVRAQIELNAEQKRTTDLMTSIAGNIPTAGPFISIASSLLFAAKSQPSYKQMKREWEGYTNTQIDNARLLDLIDRSGGYRSLVSDLQYYGGNNPKNSGLAIRDPNAPLIAKWRFIESSLVKDVGSFKSRPNEKSRPLVTAYGQLISLHLESLKTLMYLHTNGSRNKNKNTKEYRQYRRVYNKHIKQYEKTLFAELGKSSDERRSDIVQSGRNIIDKKDSSKLKFDARYPVFNQVANHRRNAMHVYFAMYAKMFDLSLFDLHNGKAKFNKHPQCSNANLSCLHMRLR